MKRYANYERCFDRPTLRRGDGQRVADAAGATRYECQHCHTHTFLVLRTIGDAKCSVCESYDLVLVED